MTYSIYWTELLDAVFNDMIIGYQKWRIDCGEQEVQYRLAWKQPEPLWQYDLLTILPILPGEREPDVDAKLRNVAKYPKWIEVYRRHQNLVLGESEYKALHILPQIYTATHATFPIQVYGIVQYRFAYPVRCIFSLLIQLTDLHTMIYTVCPEVVTLQKKYSNIFASEN